MPPLPNRRVLWFWVVLAAGCSVAAGLFGPWLIPPLDARQAPFRAMLEDGIRLVRLDLAAAAILALVSLFLWRQGPSTRPEPPRPPAGAPTPAAWLGALALLAITAALAVPRLGSTLWWDELFTLYGVVHHGPVVILTYSASANNHILNSLLLWTSLRGLGETEVVLRLFPFVFALGAVQLLYWTLLRAAGVRAALLGGLAAAAHPWLINHGVEARGYAGAILFGWAACAAFARLLCRPSTRLTALYIACCVTAFGFINTTILIPLAHGVVACLLLVVGYRRADLAPYRAGAVNLVFACLWVPVLAVLLFGLPLPQTLAYARHGAGLDHRPLGWPLGGEVLAYLTGVRTVVPALLFVGLAGLGWWVALHNSSPARLRLLMLGALVPLGTALLYVLLPGAHSSGRFFCFLILPSCCGIGLALDWLLRRRPAGWALAGVAAAGWLALLAGEHQRLFLIDRPNIKGLARELQGERVVLIGAQADVNTHYFPRAVTYQEGKSKTSLEDAVVGAEVVVEGRARKDNRLDEPDAVLLSLGFRVEKTLPTAFPPGTEYLVYRRAAPLAAGNSRRPAEQE